MMPEVFDLLYDCVAIRKEPGVPSGLRLEESGANAVVDPVRRHACFFAELCDGKVPVEPTRVFVPVAAQDSVAKPYHLNRAL